MSLFCYFGVTFSFLLARPLESLFRCFGAQKAPSPPEFAQKV